MREHTPFGFRRRPRGVQATPLGPDPRLLATKFTEPADNHRVKALQPPPPPNDVVSVPSSSTIFPVSPPPLPALKANVGVAEEKEIGLRYPGAACCP